MGFGYFLFAAAVAVALWFPAEWLGSRLFDDGTTQTFFALAASILVGGLLLAFLKVKAVRSGRYEKAGRGIRRK